MYLLGLFLFYSSITLFFGYPSHIRKSCVLFYRFLYGNITAFLRRPRTVSWEFRKHVRKFIDYSSFVLPNSLEEGILLYDFARMKNMNKLRVVYNGVELKENQILSSEIFFLNISFLGTIFCRLEELNI